VVPFLLLFSLVLGVVGCASISSEEEETAKLHLKIGTSHLNNDNYPQALTELLTAQELDPNNAVIQNNLGLTYFFRERLDLAEIHIRKAIKLEPKYSDARNNLSRVLIERGRYTEAIQEARTVMEDLTYQSPEKPLINLGMAQFKLGQYELARKSLQKALDFQRDNCLAHSYFGRTYFEVKDFTRASEALDRAAGFCQRLQFDEPQYYSALSYYQLGQKQKAEERLESLLKLYPNGRYSDKAKTMLETIRR
jgi:type IV pilus assembly protein PilF